MSQLENMEYPDWYWLNEDSKLFLSRGYLLDGVSAMGRVIQIANYAENKLGIEGFSEKFIHYMKRGYYSLSSPIWANFGIPKRGLPISCFTGDTKVIVKLENKDFYSHLEIKDIVDRLAKGEVIYALSYNEEKKETEYKRILKAWKTKESEVVRVTVQDDNADCMYGENIVSFKCTADHKFLTDNGWKEAKDIAEESLITFNDTHAEVYTVEEIDGIYEVYDLTVEDNHNFFVVSDYEYNYPAEQYDDECGQWYSEDWLEIEEIGVCVHNCFGSVCGDSISDLKFTDGEIGIMSKYGGGTSAYFGHVRPRGSTITNNGHSNGSYSFLPMFQSTVNSVNQGTSRRGMMAAYIDIEHADINEWLNIKLEGDQIQDIYWGVCVGNDWLEEMKAGDKHKRELWARVLRNRIETGVPYIFFKDNANLNTADVYKDKHMTIYASNLCVTGDTKILTKEYGHVEIGSKVGEKVTVWNGQEWSPNVELVQTGKDQNIYRVYLSDGRHLDCTDYHKWYIRKDNEIIIKRTIELNTGDQLEEYYLPDDNTSDKELIQLTISNVSKLDGLYDTFCCTEPKRNKVIFNGIMTGNCSEIMLPSSIDESFVCCLSSMNLLHYDDWKDTDAVETMIYFLDVVMTDFIEQTKEIDEENGIHWFAKARKFAERHRALGLGALGWHSYLQRNMIPFGSFEAMMKNNEIFKLLRDKTYKASEELAKRYGEPEILKGYGRRNTTLLSIAPTKSSSFILGAVSPSIEPFKSNCYIKDLAKIKIVFKNPFLMKLLEEKGKNTDDVWRDINEHSGSVQHLDFLTEHEKDVFKTFEEISQMTIIQQAAQRQQYIDQGQSLNITIHKDTPFKDINKLHLTAAELGVKSLYYQLSTSAAQAFNRDLLTCASCEG